MPNPPESKQPNASSKRPKRPVRPHDNTDLVLTPGGMRPRSLVHELQAGQHISTKGGRVRIIETATGNVVKDLGETGTQVEDESVPPPAAAGAVPGIPDTGWIENSQWQNTGKNPIVYFSTTWVVPPPPSTSNNQVVFLFNGMQPNSAAHIIQPVLQWGPSAAGGGNYWSITNWYADGQGGAATFQPLVRVNPGDVLQGVMTCTGQSGTEFSYKSSFVGHPTLDVTVSDVEELTWAYETLECYGLTTCTDYPNTAFTSMYAIEIKTGTPGTSGTDATIDWFASNSFTDCGQSCVIVSNASPGGAVYLNYRKQAPVIAVAGGGVAASEQIGLTQTDVFFVDKNGTLNVTWVVGAGNWGGPGQIGPAGLFPPGAPVASSRQFGLNQTDVFVVDKHGSLQVMWVVNAGAWGGPGQIGPTGLFPPGASIAASQQIGLNQTDVFIVDKNGNLQVMWVVNAGAWGGPGQMGPAGLFPPGAPIAASRQIGLSQTDVFVVDKHGNLQVMWVVNAGAWGGPGRMGPAGLFPPGAPIAASQQFGLSQTDVFVVDKQGSLQVMWVVNAGAWGGPGRIGPAGLFPARSAHRRIATIWTEPDRRVRCGQERHLTGGVGTQRRRLGRARSNRTRWYLPARSARRRIATVWTEPDRRVRGGQERYNARDVGAERGRLVIGADHCDLAIATMDRRGSLPAPSVQPHRFWSDSNIENIFVALSCSSHVP